MNVVCACACMRVVRVVCDIHFSHPQGATRQTRMKWLRSLISWVNQDDSAILSKKPIQHGPPLCMCMIYFWDFLVFGCVCVCVCVYVHLFCETIIFVQTIDSSMMASYD